ncbi:MAG: DNA polymerase IV, partial [Dehalococcoidia bacterium]|nr:DNA polymerase IV [Dehalococcoidia bacterium]
LWVQSEKVGADLREKGKQARCVTLKVRYADFTTITRSHTLRENASTDQKIFETGVVLLERALMKEKQAVRLIGIGVSNLVEASRQATLFAPSARKLEELNKAIDRIRDRYGFGSIQTGRAIRLKDISTQS